MPQEFSLTRAEYFSAQTLYAQRNFRRLWWAWLLLFLAITLWLQRDRIGAPGYLWLVAALLGVGVALVAVLGLVLPRVLALMMVLTVWRRQPVLQAPVSVEISDAGIRFENDRGSWQHRWSDLIARAENARVCLLYLAPNLMLVLPMRILSAADLATIRRHLDP
ncbi:YcxB family protein [Paracoccus sp. (in: a-proteobacteria)]|uniref:YcxB family protein n=1 Tax=Paracoccus sp. TaxID=267 RepID=UPI0035B35EF7